jgi:hypothetical protein
MNAPTAPPPNIEHVRIVSNGAPLDVIEAFVGAMAPTPEALSVAAARLGCSRATPLTPAGVAVDVVRKYNPAQGTRHVVDTLVRRDSDVVLQGIHWHGDAGVWRLHPSEDSTTALRSRQALVKEILRAASGRSPRGIDGVCGASDACFKVPLVESVLAEPMAAAAPGPGTAPWLDWIAADEPPDACVIQIGRAEHHVERVLWTSVRECWNEHGDLLLTQPDDELNDVIDIALCTRSGVLGERMPKARRLLQELTHARGAFTRAPAPSAPSLVEVVAVLRHTPRGEWPQCMERIRATYFCAQYVTLQSFAMALVAAAVHRTVGGPR